MSERSLLCITPHLIYAPPGGGGVPLDTLPYLFQCTAVFIGKTWHMKTEEANTDVKPGIGIQAWFRRTGNVVFVRSPCVFTENSTLEIGKVYEIHDFTESDVKLIYIKLLWVYLKGFAFHIVGIDIRTGDCLTSATSGTQVV